MESFGNYILSVVAVCIATSILPKFCSTNAASASIVRLICGIAISITVISPVLKLKLTDLTEYTSYIQADAAALVQAGADHTNEQLRTIITEKTCAYILEKASFYDCSINTVEVVLSSDPVPIPTTVQITGTYSPYIKNQLCGIIESNLGISKENQQWVYQN